MPEEGLVGLGTLPEAGTIPQRQVGVDQVVQMIIQGATISELVGMGVPEVVIEQAMMKITQMTQPAPEESGLAGAYLGDSNNEQLI